MVQFTLLHTSCFPTPFVHCSKTKLFFVVMRLQTKVQGTVKRADCNVRAILDRAKFCRSLGFLKDSFSIVFFPEDSPVCFLKALSVSVSRFQRCCNPGLISQTLLVGRGARICHIVMGRLCLRKSFHRPCH